MPDAKLPRIKLFAQIGVTGAALLSALYVILIGDYPDGHIKWATGVVGLVLGYWLR